MDARASSSPTEAFRAVASQLPLLGRALTLVWEGTGRLAALWLTLLVVQGMLPVAVVYLMRSLANHVITAVSAGGTWESVRPALVPVGLLVAVLLLTEALRSLTRWVRTAQSERVRDFVTALVHTQAARLDLAFYETPEYYDRLFRARVDAMSRPVTLLESSGSLLQNAITLAAMAVVLSEFGPWLPLALVVSTLPALGVVFSHASRQHRWRLRMTTTERRTWHYDWLLTTRETAAELRLFGLSDYYRALYSRLRGELREGQLRLAREQGVAEVAAGGAGWVITGGAIAWMLWRAARRSITLGDLVLFYQAFSQGQRLMRALLENVGQVYQSSLFLSNLFEFLALEPQLIDGPKLSQPPARLQQGIRFRSVTFRYPGSDRPALHDFSLIVPAGRIAAIVGPNGAGKSTLIKLLCRLYDPAAGRIDLDGTDLRDLPLGDVRRLITVLFQEPVRYSATAAENISFGDLAAEAGTSEIEAAAKAAGADTVISRLPASYATLLGKWFGGVELSAGEWQRLALARAFLRKAPIIVLDEPTSAMDSWAEADWMQRFRVLAAGRTAIVVTHRLTTAMRADVIHVMDEGRIVESGCHDALLALGARYAEAWEAQMRDRSSGGPDRRDSVAVAMMFPSEGTR